MVNSPKQIRMCIMGSPLTGKTSFIESIMFPHQERPYEATVENCYNLKIRVLKKEISLKVIDSGGTCFFPSMERINIVESEAFILMFAQHEQQSFKHVYNLQMKIRSVRKDSPLIYVVANEKPNNSELYSHEAIYDRLGPNVFFVNVKRYEESIQILMKMANDLEKSRIKLRKN